MSRRFKKWMAEAWFAYLTWGTMFAVFFVGIGVEAKLSPIACALLASLSYLTTIGVRALQYIGYDFSSPDND